MNKKERFVYRIYRKKTIERIDRKIDLLGKQLKYNTFTILTSWTIVAIILFLSLLIFCKKGYLLAPFCTILFLIGVEKLLFDYPIKKRAKKLEQEAIFFFEVLDLTLESDRNIKTALELTANNIDSELSKEFKKTLAEVNLGKSFTESLVSMKLRIPSDSINTILLNLIQSADFGNSINESLTNQLDYLREKQLLEAKAKIAKLPTKVSVISVFFFIPIMLLMILSPVIIEFINR